MRKWEAAGGLGVGQDGTLPRQVANLTHKSGGRKVCVTARRIPRFENLRGAGLLPAMAGYQPDPQIGWAKSLCNSPADPPL